MPDCETRYYVNITGSLGIFVTGIVAYRGDYGLRNILDSIGMTSPAMETAQANADRDMVKAYFGVKHELFREDLNVLKDLGLSYGDDPDWPVIQSSIPGFYPGSLDASEIDNMRIVLQQVMILAEEFRDLGYEVEDGEDDEGPNTLVYGRFSTKSESDGELKWETRPLRVDMYELDVTFDMLTPKQIQTVQSIDKEMGCSLIIGFGYDLNMVRTTADHRRYRPKVVYFIQDSPKKVLGKIREEEGENFDLAVISKIISVLEEHGLPKIFEINHPKVDSALCHIREITGINIFFDNGHPECMK